MAKPSDEEVEVIEIIEDYEHVYHLKPQNDKYKFYPVRKISKGLFEIYREQRDQYRSTRGLIKRHFKQMKDKPMRVERYHVNEGEVYKFGTGGAPSIIRDN